MSEIDKAVIDGKTTANELLLAMLLAASPLDLSDLWQLSTALTTLLPPEGLSDEAQDHFRVSVRDQSMRIVGIASAIRTTQKPG